LGLIDFIVSDFYDTAPNTIEFFVSLRRVNRNLDATKSLERQLVSIDWAEKRIHGG
jgi:hypothetical protein